MKRFSLLHEHMRQAAIMRKRRREKRRIIAFHIRRDCRKSGQTRKSQYSQFGARPYLDVFAPTNFTIQNLENVLVFLQNTERQCKNSNSKVVLKVNLNDIVEIDSYAICFLLSMLNRMSHKNISYWGTYPDHQEAKDYIIESGFLNLVKSNIKRPSNNRFVNRIFMIGKENVDSHRIGKAVRDSMAFITGREECYPPVYENILEICANSVEHGNVNTQDKNWLVSISFEEGKVHYILVDTGVGILATLKKKFSQKVKDATIRADTQILCSAFRKEYQSATGEINRHKGLPIIYESFTEGYVSDLIVVTNKVYYDFGRGISRELKYGYSGVLYSWTISKSNYDKWNKSLVL